MTKAAIFYWLAACIWLGGCRCRPAAEPSTGSFTLAIESVISTPEATARAFFRACAAGDQAAALVLLAPLTRPRPAGVVSSASHVPPAGIGMPELTIETAGETTYVPYQWQEDERTAQGELVLIQKHNTWLIANSQLTYRRPTRTPIPPVPTLAPTASMKGTP